jgi:hypothetical protein
MAFLPPPSAPVVVRIDRPPPRRSVQPIVHALSAGERLLRVYTPGEWNNTALTFRRRGGPLLRFDHHSDPGQNPDDQSRGIHYSAPTLEGCLVEVFGDDGLISTQDRQLGSLLVTEPGKRVQPKPSAAVRPDPTPSNGPGISIRPIPNLTGSSMATPTTVQTPWPCLSEPMAP